MPPYWEVYHVNNRPAMVRPNSPLVAIQIHQVVRGPVFEPPPPRDLLADLCLMIPAQPPEAIGGMSQEVAWVCHTQPLLGLREPIEVLNHPSGIASRIIEPATTLP